MAPIKTDFIHPNRVAASLGKIQVTPLKKWLQTLSGLLLGKILPSEGILKNLNTPVSVTDLPFAFSSRFYANNGVTSN
ncbi:hypothetical protein [Xenorhabdus entomophaga]|uniref:hypothetical protein n=1 Tax=Xenorhabdus entomophaga TaxID=3136257 RepID=UPI0030F3F782